MNKIVSTKITSAIFLAIVLVAGTITALVSPSFIIGVNAQPYYDSGMDNNNYKKLYGKDNRDKSKDNTKVDINRLNCINTNLNINGNNTGDINIGNKGQGYLGGYSSANGGYSSEGYSKQDKGFDCIINNNNNNINIVAGGGNVTDGNVTEPQTCEECFERFLTEDEISRLVGSATLEMYCDAIESGSIDENRLRLDLAGDVSMVTLEALIECLENLGILTP